MEKFVQAVKQVAKGPKELAFFFKLIQWLQENDAAEEAKTLADRIVASGANPFAGVDPFTPSTEVVQALTAFCAEVNGSAPVKTDFLEGDRLPSVKEQTTANRVRAWLLTLPRKAEVTSKEIEEKLGLDWKQVGSIVSQLRVKDRILRFKRDPNGKMRGGRFAKTAKAEKIIKAYLAGRSPNRAGKGLKKL